MTFGLETYDNADNITLRTDSSTLRPVEVIDIVFPDPNTWSLLNPDHNQSRYYDVPTTVDYTDGKHFATFFKSDPYDILHTLFVKIAIVTGAVRITIATLTGFTTEYDYEWIVYGTHRIVVNKFAS